MDPALIFGARSGSIKQDPSLTMKEAFAKGVLDRLIAKDRQINLTANGCASCDCDGPSS